MANTPNLDLVPLVTGQSGAEIKVNTFLNQFDALIHLAVIDRDLTAPPGGESDGDVYIPAATATGDWAGEEDSVAYFYGGWLFTTPNEGFTAYVKDEDIYLTFDGSSWVSSPRLEVEAGLTASTTQTQGAGTSITKAMTEFSTVANPGDAATLDAAVQGRERIVINGGAETLQIFAASGDDIDGGSTNGSIFVAPGSVVVFRAKDATSWHTTGNRDMVKIGAVTASNDATVEFADGIDGTFKFYIVRYWAIPVDDSVSLLFRISVDGGATFEAGASDYRWSNRAEQSDGLGGAAASNGDTSINLDQVIGSDTGEAVAGELKLFAPSDTDLNTHVTLQSDSQRASAVQRHIIGGGVYEAVTVVDAIQFLFSAGNVESGEFVLYGVR